jgi:hypothetical protein
MAQEERKNWRELCKAALRAKDPDDVLKILQELNQALKSEEQVRRDFREARRMTSPPVKSDVNNCLESNDTSAYFQH